MTDERDYGTREKAALPRFLVAALAAPLIIIGAAALLARHIEGRPGHDYTPISIFLVSAVAAVFFATTFLVWGWRDGERPRWIGILGVAMSAYFLKWLLFGA